MAASENEPFLPYETARLVLRPFHLTDASVLAAYRDDPEVARWQDWALPFTEEMAREFLQSQVQLAGPTAGRWTQIAIESQGELVGDVAVGLDERSTTAMIGYTLRQDWQGRGYAIEAVGALVDRLFAVTGVRRIAATLDPANVASARLLEQLGFRYEGRAVAIADVRGGWADDDRYALLSADRDAWLARPTEPPETVRLIEVGPDELPAVRQIGAHHSQEQRVGSAIDALVDGLVPPVENGVELSPWIRGVEADGSVVGLLVLSQQTAAHPHAVLRHLVVDRRWQRRGVGRRALEEAAGWLRADGARVLRARWVDAKGGPGPFLERVGFAVTSTDGSQVEGELRL